MSTIKDLVKDAPDTEFNSDLDAIALAASEVFQVSYGQLFVRDRSMNVCLARQVAMAIAYDFGYSFAQIERFFGMKNGTASHARKVVCELAKDGNPRYRSLIKAVTMKVKTP